MSLLIVGTVAFDSIETPFGKIKHALGGSASYFSLAASNFTRPSIIGVVGEDFKHEQRAILEKNNIDLSGLTTATGKTFAWGGKYSFDLNNRDTIFTDLNVLEHFKPKLSAQHKSIGHLFLGNAHPGLQLDVLKQMENPKLIGLDTMNFWMDSALKPLKTVLKQIDLFVINDSEARQLTGEHNLVKAAKQILKLMDKKKRVEPTLIIKQGEYGLLMFRGQAIFHLPGFPLEDVIDPTGAGDSFAGGLMGYLAATNNLSWDNFKRACVAGSVVASFCVEKLGTKRLQEISAKDIKNRFTKFKTLTYFEI